MKFPRQDMQEMAYGDSDYLIPIEEDTIDSSRWSIQHKVIFKDKNTGKTYVSFYSVGATEMQDESPYEWDGKEIECDEVKQEKVEALIWVIQKEIADEDVAT